MRRRRQLASHAARTRPAPPRGMTLIELLLVLALLVVAGSLTVPAIFDSFTSTRLRRAGDQVLARWAEARATAVVTGAVQQFRFAPETGQYRVEAWTLAPADGDASAPAEPSAPDKNADAEFANSGVLTAGDSSLAEAGLVAATLDGGVTFYQGQAVSQGPPAAGEQVASLAERDGGWSKPILFFPDGTASQATVVLANDREHYLRLTLRGLTGVGRASDVLVRDELVSGSAPR